MPVRLAITPAPRLRSWLVLIPLVALALAMALEGGGSVLALAILQCALVLLPFVHCFLENQRDWFEPIYAYAALYLLYYGGRTIYLLYVEPGSDTYLPKVDIDGPNVARALIVALLGFVAFLWGYFSSLGDRSALRLPVVNVSHLPSSIVLVAALVLFVICLGSRLYLLATGKILAYAATQFTTEPWENIVAYPATFGIVAFAMAVAYQFRNRKILWLFWVFVFPAEMLFWFLRGSRTSILFAPLALILLYNYIVKPLNVRKIFAAFSAAFLLMAASYPIHTAYRGVTSFGDIRLESLAQDIPRQFVAIQQERQSLPSDERGLVSAWRVIVEKASMVEAVAVTILSTEMFDYLWGSTLLMLPALWIPQVLWPSKYDFLETANVMAGTILFGTAEPGYGLALGQVAELYLNFGLVGVTAGMFMIGALMRGFYVFCRREELGYFGPVIYAVMWPHLMNSHGVWLYMTFGDSIRFVGLILLLLWLMRVIATGQQATTGKLGVFSQESRKVVDAL